MKQVEIDFFKEISAVRNLRAGPGGWLSYEVRRADMVKDGYRTALYTYKDGRQKRVASDVQAHWWRGGELLFAALRGRDKKHARDGLPLTVLYTVSPEGGPAQEWMRLPYEIEELVFLADGSFVFTATCEPGVRAIVDGRAEEAEKRTALQKLHEVEVFTELPFWRNGEGYARQKRLRLYHCSAGAVSALTNEMTQVEHLRVGPGGEEVFFIATVYEEIEPLYNTLVRLKVSTGKQTDLSVGAAFCHYAFALLVDGSAVVFGTDMRQYGMMQNGDFYRVAGDGAARLLYNGGEYDWYDSVLNDVSSATEPHWAAVGSRVYWVTTREEASHLMCIDADTGAITRCTEQDGAVMELATDGQEIYFTALQELRGPEVYRLQEKGEVRLTRLNAPAEKEYELQTPQLLHCTGAEGTDIRGWVLPPQGLDTDKKWPAVLYIHGGPKAVFGSVLYHELQYLAARGYAVLYCNPTGGDGRGNDFADLRGRWGGVDYEDLMAFTDAALKAYPWIDPARLGAVGGSYGGFMVNWIIGHTRRFAAAVSQRGISNWLTMATTTDIGFQFVPDQMGVDPWQDPQALWAYSPLRYANEARTPTLFVHSEEDYRCFYAESLQMYTALKMRGVPARLCLFHGENHELSRGGKPSHRVRRLQEIAGWLDEYLQPGK